jgi:formamidopyrimidine-DNA glycosylase
MPELPEVEHLRRSLEPWLIGGRFGRVVIGRRDVINSAPPHKVCANPRDALERALLANSLIVATHRHGKQLALESETGAVLVVQLGMTGSLGFERGSPPRGVEGRHRHLRWEFSPNPNVRLEGNSTASKSATSSSHDESRLWRFVFRDPRRFGGVTCFASTAELRASWNKLGPDALTIDARALAAELQGSRRPVKAALLDQGTVAGIGNIYADESLYAAKIHPCAPAGDLRPAQITILAAQIRRILAGAVVAGGSTLRDYRDAFGQPGSAVQTHLAYGRAGLPCARCSQALVSQQVAGRTTTYCPTCQPPTYPHASGDAETSGFR